MIYYISQYKGADALDPLIMYNNPPWSPDHKSCKPIGINMQEAMELDDKRKKLTYVELVIQGCIPWLVTPQILKLYLCLGIAMVFVLARWHVR